jgi:hypothetical protein
MSRTLNKQNQLKLPSKSWLLTSNNLNLGIILFKSYCIFPCFANSIATIIILEVHGLCKYNKNNLNVAGIP